MRKKTIIIFILLIVAWLVTVPIEAKLLPRFRGVSKNTGNYTGVLVAVRLRPDRRALILILSNLPVARSVSYTLTYQGNGTDQGVAGTIDSSAGATVTRELLFGTCSSGVCRYHQHIQNMRLEIESDLLNGKKTIRRFRIKA